MPTLNQWMESVNWISVFITVANTRLAHKALNKINKGAVIETIQAYRFDIMSESANEINGKNNANSVQLLIQVYRGVPST